MAILRPLLVMAAMVAVVPSARAAGPATPSAARVVELANRIRDRVRVTRYQHFTRVRERDGLYAWDCSGMAAWILSRAAPGAFSAIRRDRPVARDFHRVIAAAPTDRPRMGWVRIESIADALPGDVFAWLRPPSWPRRNTGHVGFILEPPRPVASMQSAWAIRIADATSVPHEDDSREGSEEGGFGMGTIVFLADESGSPTHYAWHGTRSRWAVPTEIAIGRVVR